MRFAIPLLALAFVVPALAVTELAAQPQTTELIIDSSEAHQALAILHKQLNKQPVTNEDWQKLFASLPYRGLKSRESEIKNSFTDEQFKTFLTAPESLQRVAEWEKALAEIESSKMPEIASHVLAWLPAEASIQARVFPMIKPRENSFVWRDAQGGTAIFLYLSNKSRASFEDTVAHECHHIGLMSLNARQKALLDKLPKPVSATVDAMGAFGEGEAVLAAAGTTDRRPHWQDDALARARWDSDMMHFNQDVATLTQFFTEVLDGKLTGDAVDDKVGSFFGYQGPWYTVGYEMAALVEKRYGREEFLKCMLDPRLLLVRYNQVAAEANQRGARLALWPQELLTRVYADQPVPAPLPAASTH